MPQLSRFHVVVRFGDRIVDDRCAEGRLTLGDGGDVVVPGLGDVVTLIDGERVCAVDGLVARTEGDRVELVSTAYPELEITVERIGNERIAIRDRFWTLPARETIFAGALAGCLATMLGGKVVIGTLTEPEIEREREQTALELAMYETPVVPIAVLPTVAFAEIPAPVEVEDALPSNAEVLADASASPLVPALHDVQGEPEPPAAIEVPEAAPPKKRARARRARAEQPSAVAVMKVLGHEPELVNILGSSTDEIAVLDVIRDDDGGRIAALLEDARLPTSSDVGGVPGGVGIGVGTGRVVLPDGEPARDDRPTATATARTEPAPDPTAAEVVTPQIVVAEGPPPDPQRGQFSLAEAFAGDESLEHGTGTLTAVITTNKGNITCELFEAQAPLTVANFVGLARGTRDWLDAPSGRWRKQPFYDGLVFHRVVKGFVIQGGDPSGDGKGGPGYELADEHHADLRFDGAGVLAMANKGPNTGGSQFFVALDRFAHLDRKHSIFGKCDTETAQRIAQVDVDSTKLDRPLDPVTIARVEIVRVAAPEPPRHLPPHAQRPRDEPEPGAEQVAPSEAPQR